MSFAPPHLSQRLLTNICHHFPAMSLLGEWLQGAKADLIIFSSFWLVSTAIDNTKLWHDLSLFPLGESLPGPPTCSRKVTCKPPLGSCTTFHSQWAIFENIWLNQKTNRLWSGKTWAIWSAWEEAFFYGVNLQVSQASSPLKHLLKTQCWKDKASVLRAYYKLAITSASPKPRWVRLFLFHPPLALVYFHTCTATCCVLCVSAPREWVMRTAGARLRSRGSLTEKWAEAPTLPAASGRQSCSSAWQPRNLQAALKDSATCNGNFMPWHPDHCWPNSTSGQNAETHPVGA